MPSDMKLIAMHRGLMYNGNTLPYNPRLRDKSRELRNNPTPEERLMWGLLRKLPFQVYRQKIIDHFIVDFYIPKKKAVLELDGSQHFSYKGRIDDEERSKILEMYGITVVRAPNSKVKSNPYSIVETIAALPDVR